MAGDLSRMRTGVKSSPGGSRKRGAEARLLSPCLVLAGPYSAVTFHVIGGHEAQAAAHAAHAAEPPRVAGGLRGSGLDVERVGGGARKGAGRLRKKPKTK